MDVLVGSDRSANPSRQALWNLVPLLVGFGVVAILGWWTHGLNAFTSYSATLIEAGPLPRRAPPLRFIDTTGEIVDATRGEPPYRLVQFFYARCPDACPLAMGRIPRIEAALGDLVPTRVRILSLSFDHDSPELLREMWIAHGRPAGWTIAPLADSHPEESLRRLGVLVIRRDDGLINHSLDLFLLDSEGRVRAVFSPDDTAAAIASAIAGLV
ncbi:MAG: SCO family protein [bacterium]